MSVTREDIKAAYEFGVKNKNVLSVSEYVKSGAATNEKCTMIVNALVNARLCGLPEKDQSGLVMRLRDSSQIKLLQSLSPEEHSVFSVVEKSGAKGIQSKDVAPEATRLLRKPINNLVVNKSFKILEDKTLVKSVKSIQQKGKKIYILYNMEPDASIMGGSFYHDGEFNSEMVENYRSQILLFIASGSGRGQTATGSRRPGVAAGSAAVSPDMATSGLVGPVKSASASAGPKPGAGPKAGSGSGSGSVSLNSIVHHLKQLGLVDAVSERDIQTLIRTLVLDQELNETVHPSTAEYYYAISRWPDMEDLESIPCVSCQFQDFCQVEDSLLTVASYLRHSVNVVSADILKGALQSARSNQTQKHGQEPSSNMASVSVSERGTEKGSDRGTATTSSAATSKIHPSTCPYFSQWVDIHADPWVDPPETV